MTNYRRATLAALTVFFLSAIGFCQSTSADSPNSPGEATRLDQAAPAGSLTADALPVAGQRGTARVAPRPLSMNGERWRNVATTFDPDDPLSAYGNLAPGGYPKGDLESKVDLVRYQQMLAEQAAAECMPADDYGMHHYPMGKGYAGPDYEGDSPMGDLWSYYHNVNHRWWTRLDYLNWRVRGYEVPALVSQSPVGTGLGVAGVVPGAEVLFGDERINEDFRKGGRVRLGWWAVDGQFVGYQAEYFGLESSGENFNASSPFNGPILARPFFNTDPGVNAPDASLISGPGIAFGGNTYDADGVINVTTESNIHSAGIVRRHVLWADFERNFRVDYLIGYRYLRLDDLLEITDISTLNNPSGGVIPAGTLVRRIDDFKTSNDFHGGEIGLMAELHRGRFSLEAVGKLGVGNNYQQIEVDGSLALDPGGTSGGFTPTVGAGGLLAQPTLNEGRFERNAFTLLPEAELNVAIELTRSIRALVGYNVIYVTRVVRPGAQVDTNLNETRFPPPAAPAGPFDPQPKFVQSYFWMHGITAGIEARW